jgi:hypothetical protein
VRFARREAQLIEYQSFGGATRAVWHATHGKYCRIGFRSYSELAYTIANSDWNSTVLI